MAKTVRQYSIITLGAVVFALSYDAFFAPNPVAMAGVTGLARVMNHFLPALSVGTLSILLNVPLFLAGWRFLGFHLLASSLYAALVSSLAIDAIAYPFRSLDPLLASLCGGALMGLGLGLVFSQDATTGGTDIAAQLLGKKFPWLPLGKLVLVPDGVVLALSALTLGGVEAALYGVVALFVSGRAMDAVLYGLDTSKAAFIVSDRWREIADELMEERGVTILRGAGGYTGQEKQVLLVAFKQREITRVKSAVRRLDGGAFMIVCSAWEVLGEGFQSLKKPPAF